MRFLSLYCLLLVGSLKSAPLTLHVAVDGNDSANGTEAAPFATLERARDELRKLKQSAKIPKEGAVVSIHKGVYERKLSLLLTADDSGSAEAPITYRAHQGKQVHLLSGKQIPTSAWKPLSKTAAKRLHPKAKANQLYELDYDALKILNGDQLSNSKQNSGGHQSFVLFANGQRQTLSQWPNLNEKVTDKSDPGWATPNGTRDNLAFYFGKGGQPADKADTNELDLDGTNRSQRWKQRLDSGHDLWLRGHWRTPWAPRLSQVKQIDLKGEWIELTNIPPGGMGSKYTKSFKAHDGGSYRVGSGTERYYALNMLEEIDQPGEYAIDFQDRRVYFFPPKKLEDLKITIADSTEPIVKAKGASHVNFDQITLQGGLNSGFVFENCNDIAVRGCTIDGVGQHGIVVSGGTKHLIQSNDIRETGHSGIVISGVGNRKTLSHGGSLISNNHISHTGKLHFDCGAISVNNVIGITFSKNLIHHTPSRAYDHQNDNDVLFEYNEIHNCALKTSDTGATYTHGKWSTYGNLFRYNFIHHNQRANGFYCDDGDSGDTYRFNIIHQCIDALKFGGGHDNIAENNLLIQNSQQRIDDRGISRNYRLGTRYETELRAFKPFEEPWLSYGKRLREKNKLTTNLWTDVLDPKWLPEHPHGCRYANNVTVKSANWKKPRNGKVTITNNVAADSAKFQDYSKMDLRTTNETILGKFPELNTVFPKIGLQKDDYRKTIPTRKSVGGLQNFGTSVDGEEDADLDQ